MKIKRIAVRLLLLPVAVVACVAVTYRQWHAATSRQLRSDGKIIETARGPIEYQSIGKGSVVLILHGTLGGYDQGLITAHMLNSPSMRFLTISRPG